VTPRSRDHRDMVIEHLADSEAALLVRVVELETDLRSYRELAREAVHSLHAAHRRDLRYRDTLRRLLDELRARCSNPQRRVVATSSDGAAA
jgi:hypothetical protein